MLDITSEPQNRKLNTQFAKKAVLRPGNFPGICSTDVLLPPVEASLFAGAGKGAAEASSRACQITHSHDLSFPPPPTVGVVSQPDERYICKLFAEKVKGTPAARLGELRKGTAHGKRTWSWRSPPLLGTQ
jgi:hypothetical protein